MSIIEDCTLKNVATLPFVLQKGACQARLYDQVMLCFSGHENTDDTKDERYPGEKICWQFDEVDGQKGCPVLNHRFPDRTTHSRLIDTHRPV